MEIRTFTAGSMPDALAQVRQEFGNDAVILSTGRSNNVDSPGSFEVTAALPAAAPRRKRIKDVRSWTPPKLERQDSAAKPIHRAVPNRPAQAPTNAIPTEPKIAAPPKETPKPAPVQPKSPEVATPSSDMIDLQRGVLSLQRDLKEMNRQVRFGSGRGLSMEDERLVERLEKTGLPRVLACSLVDELPGSEAMENERLEALRASIARRLDCSLPVSPPEEGPLKLAFVGPTGVGKTTLIAKLLLQPKLFGAKRAGLISLDTRRIAAVEQTRKIAGLTRTRLELIYRSDDLEPALERLKACDLILIDSPGAGPSDRLSRERTSALLKALNPKEVHLVLPATARLLEQKNFAKIFAALGVNRLAFTKLDESSSSGALLESAVELNVPLSWVSTGQRIPDAIRLAEPTSLAAWIQSGAWSA
jgi:flagellar biosynthesis protein FlhF